VQEGPRVPRLRVVIPPGRPRQERGRKLRDGLQILERRRHHPQVGKHLHEGDGGERAHREPAHQGIGARHTV
jgi:hypothetical protein